MNQAEQDRVTGRAVREHAQALRLRAAYETELIRVACGLKEVATEVADLVAERDAALVSRLEQRLEAHAPYIQWSGLVELLRGYSGNAAVIASLCAELRELGAANT